MKKDGRDDEYMPEFTGEGFEEESFDLDDTPLKGLELEPGELPPEGTSLAKKLGIGLGLFAATIVVTYFLVQREKAKVAAQAPIATVIKTAEVPQVSVTPAQTEVSDDAEVSAATQNNAAASAELVKPDIEPATQSTSIALEALKKPSLNGTDAVQLQAESSAAKIESNTVEMAQQATTAGKTEEAAVTNVPSTTADSPALVEQVSTVMNESKSNQEKINNLSTQVTSLESSITSLSKTVDSINTKFDSLQTTPKTVQSVVNNNSAKEVENSEAYMPQNKLSYVLRAIVPGRAWIENSLAGPLSVTVGDRVPGLGVVKSLDSEVGEVTLESGEVIMYGPDDH